MRDKTVLTPAAKALNRASWDERSATRDFAIGALKDIGTSETEAVPEAR